MDTDHRFASNSARGGPPRPRSTPGPQAATVRLPILETSETITMDLYRKVPSTGQDSISVAVPQIRSSIPHYVEIADLVERVFRAHPIEAPSEKRSPRPMVLWSTLSPPSHVKSTLPCTTGPTQRSTPPRDPTCGPTAVSTNRALRSLWSPSVRSVWSASQGTQDIQLSRTIHYG